MARKDGRPRTTPDLAAYEARAHRTPTQAERDRVRAALRAEQERRDAEALEHSRARREALSPAERDVEDAERARLRTEILGGL